jgi:hypothetical protein
MQHDLTVRNLSDLTPSRRAYASERRPQGMRPGADALTLDSAGR